MLDGKSGNLSVIAHPGVNVDSEQFARAAQDVWQVEAVVSKYSEISAPFVSANGVSSLKQNIMRQSLEIMQPVGAIEKGVDRVLNGIVRMIGARGDPNDPLFPTLTFYFVRFVETLAAYVTLFEHLSSPKLLPITPNDLMTRVWDLINRDRKWKAIARGENVEKLFRKFHFAAPPLPERAAATASGTTRGAITRRSSGSRAATVKRRINAPAGRRTNTPAGRRRTIAPAGRRTKTDAPAGRWTKEATSRRRRSVLGRRRG
jgi:hypothetical protein